MAPTRVAGIWDGGKLQKRWIMFAGLLSGILVCTALLTVLLAVRRAPSSPETGRAARAVTPPVDLFARSESTDHAADVPAGCPKRSGRRPATNVRLKARAMEYSPSTITLRACAPVLLRMAVVSGSEAHNVSMYEYSGAPVFAGRTVRPGATRRNVFVAPPKGEYFFQCDLHPTMAGSVVVR